MTRWEYALVGGGESGGLQVLNEKGEQGWECFAHEVTTGNPQVALHWFWLKRPLPDTTPRGLSGRLAAAAYDGREQP